MISRLILPQYETEPSVTKVETRRYEDYLLGIT